MDSPNTAVGRDLVDELHKISSVIATARRLVAEGGYVELSSLENKVQRLCDAVRDHPPENRTAVTSAMEDLIGNLDRLAEELTAQFQANCAQLEGEARYTAMRAYRVSKERTEP